MFTPSSRFKDLAVQERPQERLEANGAGALSDTELIAMLLRSGTARLDVVSLSSVLLKKAGSLYQLIHWSKDEFMEMEGIGKVKALQLVAVMEMAKRVIKGNRAEPPVFDDARGVYDFLMPTASGLEVEKFWALCLNRKNRLIREVEVTSGTASSSLVHPREVFKEAIRLGASGLIVAHNHPSGDPAPSAADIKVTRTLREASQIMGIDLFDHVVIGHDTVDPRGLGYYSFKDAGVL